MVFTKAALTKVGGFDPQFTAAGDDVDICWRMLDAGLTLGFSPAAFVWHFRRNTIKAYYGQQRGYGRAEAMLYPLYSERFNVMGQIAWRGTIPGIARTIPGGNRKRVLWKTATASAQTLFDPGLTLSAVLPQTLESTLLSAIALVTCFVLGVSVIPAAAMLALGPVWALYYAWHAPLEKFHDSFMARILIAYLAYTGPMVRTMTRYKTRAKAQTGRGAAESVRQRPSIDWSGRALHLSYWNEEYVTRDRILERMQKLFARTGHAARVDAGWNDYDLEVRPNPWTRVELKTADEEHGGNKLKNHVLARVKITRIAKLALAGSGGGSARGCGRRSRGLAGTRARLGSTHRRRRNMRDGRNGRSRKNRISRHRRMRDRTESHAARQTANAALARRSRGIRAQASTAGLARTHRGVGFLLHSPDPIPSPYPRRGLGRGFTPADY